MGQLASGVAHEINNPATIISGESQLRVEDIKDWHERLAQAKSGELSKAAVADLLKSYEELVMSNIKEVNRIKEIIRRGLRYSRKGTEGFALVDLPPVHGNLTQLQEVLLNLAINACQAMDEHPPDAHQALTIHAWAEQTVAHVEVKDTGPGIPEEKRGKVFETFYTTKQTGTGLGLFLVYRIVQHHQGKIDFHSVVGEGTTFTITLPIYQETKVTDAS